MMCSSYAATIYTVHHILLNTKSSEYGRWPHKYLHAEVGKDHPKWNPTFYHDYLMTS